MKIITTLLLILSFGFTSTAALADKGDKKDKGSEVAAEQASDMGKMKSKEGKAKAEANKAEAKSKSKEKSKGKKKSENEPD